MAGIGLLRRQSPVEVGEAGGRLRREAAAMDLAVMAEDAVQGLQAQVPAPA